MQMLYPCSRSVSNWSIKRKLPYQLQYLARYEYWHIGLYFLTSNLRVKEIESVGYVPCLLNTLSQIAPLPRSPPSMNVTLGGLKCSGLSCIGLNINIPQPNFIRKEEFDALFYYVGLKKITDFCEHTVITFRNAKFK